MEKEEIKDNVDQKGIKPIMSENNFIREHPVLIYFVLTFAISWSGVFILAFSTGMPAPAEISGKIGPIAYLPFLLGPIVTSFLLTGFIDGRKGLRGLLVCGKVKVPGVAIGIPHFCRPDSPEMKRP